MMMFQLGSTLISSGVAMSRYLINTFSRKILVDDSTIIWILVD